MSHQFLGMALWQWLAILIAIPVAAGLGWLAVQVLRLPWYAIASRLADRTHRSTLSPRELEILELLSRGFTNKEIGRAFGISRYTVRNHINSINQKLDVCDRTEAASVAIKQGIITLSN